MLLIYTTVVASFMKLRWLKMWHMIALYHNIYKYLAGLHWGEVVGQKRKTTTLSRRAGARGKPELFT